MDQLYYFCSRECLACYRYLMSQVSIEPFYLRKLPKIELLEFDSQSFNHSAESNGLDLQMKDLTIKENTFSMTELSSAMDVSLKHSSKVKHSVQSHNQENRKVHSLSGKNSTVHIEKEKGTKELEDDDDTILSCSSSEDEGWLVPSKKKTVVKLSVFAKIWMYLDRLITSDSKLVVKGLDIHQSVVQVNSLHATRLNLFSKSIIMTFNSIKKSFKINILLEDDLLKLMKSFNYEDFSSVLSKMENWILTSIFLRVLALNSDIISKEFDGKWNEIIEKTGLSLEQFNVLCQAF